MDVQRTTFASSRNLLRIFKHILFFILFHLDTDHNSQLAKARQSIFAVHGQHLHIDLAVVVAHRLPRAVRRSLNTVAERLQSVSFDSKKGARSLERSRQNTSD